MCHVQPVYLFRLGRALPRAAALIGRAGEVIAPRSRFLSLLSLHFPGGALPFPAPGKLPVHRCLQGSSISGGKGGGFHCDPESGSGCDVGIHAFSQDGERWTFTGTAWSNRVRFTTGAEYRFTRRERPSLLFDAQGAITALSTGVQLKGRKYVAGEDACYTLLQPVRR